VQFFWMKFTTF